LYTEKKNIKPNVVLIITDDQAYGDLSLTGNPILETPNIDKLAKEGIFADHFYVSPVCAPTRASLFTGKYHQRTGVSGVTRGREVMNLNEITIANIYGSLGYSTGIFGKWHNGSHYPYHPLGRGFEEFVGFTAGHWKTYFDTTIEKNGEPFLAKGYLPDVFTDEAIKFIENNTKENTPFLCYIPFQTPHTPLQVPDKYFNKYKEKGVDDFNATIYGMCENIDFNVGRVIDKLNELEIRDNTIVVFLSDNGPLNFRFNQGLKGRKGMVDEGGVKVPFIINWEKHIKAGTVINHSLAHIDILPTLLDLTHKEYQLEKEIDGISFKSLLFGKTDFPNRKLFSEWSGKKRVLSDNYLMINDELFDLKNDPNQKHNIRELFPELYNSLLNDYEKWYNEALIPQEKKYTQVGFKEYPKTTLPAHEANLFPPFEFRKDRRHTGIAYHRKYGWAHDWIDYWTKTEAYIEWDIEVVEDGEFEFFIKYALAEKDKGVELELEVANQKIRITEIPVFEHNDFPNFDRILRDQEAPETDWDKFKVGTLKLEKGSHKIELKSTNIPGNKSIEIKEMQLVKKT
jgi:arylsulfatase A-like enzyme